MGAKRNLFYVPWADVFEWNTVRDQIFSSDVKEIKKAYETILMWKLKCPNVPAYVESTYSLLQVMLKEYEMITNENSQSSLYDERGLRLCYSTALIRFVNHITSINSYKGQTIYSAAKSHNVPDWIINLRHDAAHSQQLPTLDALHNASELSLQWLLDNYWNNEDNIIPKDSSISQIDSNSESTLEMNIIAQNLFQKAFDLWELCSQKKYEEVLPIIDMGQEFILYLEEILELYFVYFKGLEDESTEYFKILVHGYDPIITNDAFIRQNYKTKTFQRLFLKFLKDFAQSHESVKHSLVTSLMETSFLSDGPTEPKKWEKVIHLIQELGLFSFFLRTLFQMAGKGSKNAARWLSAMHNSIVVLRKKWKMFKVLKKENNNFQTKHLKRRVHNLCKKQSGNIFLEIFKPPLITLDMLINVIENPEYINPKTIIKYLCLIKKPLPPSTRNLLRALLYLHKHNDSASPRKRGMGKCIGVLDCDDDDSDESHDEDKIYTVEDLECRAEKQLNVLVCEEAKTEGNKWVKSSIDTHVWRECPFGLLPFQTKVDCTMPEGLTWKRIPPAPKEIEIPLLKHVWNVKKLQDV